MPYGLRVADGHIFFFPPADSHSHSLILHSVFAHPLNMQSKRAHCHTIVASSLHSQQVVWIVLHRSFAAFALLFTSRMQSKSTIMHYAARNSSPDMISIIAGDYPHLLDARNDVCVV